MHSVQVVIDNSTCFLLPGTGPFHFQLYLYENGTIAFVYRKVSSFFFILVRFTSWKERKKESKGRENKRQTSGC